MYHVIAQDGSQYGPVDLPTLQTWINEGRVLPNTMVKGPDGVPLPASNVPGLQFSFAQAPNASAPYMSPPAQAHMPYAREANFAPAGGLSAATATKFNWAAFLWGWLWGVNHKKPITLISLAVGLIPYLGGIVGLGLGIWYGTQGNRWAWESGRFQTEDEMLACQRIWVKWWLWILVGTLVLAVLGAILIAVTSPRS